MKAAEQVVCGFQMDLGMSLAQLQQDCGSYVNAGNIPIWNTSVRLCYILTVPTADTHNVGLSFWGTFILSPEFEYWSYSTACSGKQIPACLNFKAEVSFQSPSNLSSHKRKTVGFGGEIAAWLGLFHVRQRLRNRNMISDYFYFLPYAFVYHYKI